MRKLILISIATMMIVAVRAQVPFFEGTFKEALAKAKAENKMVMVIGSTTWCGPCKFLAESILTTKKSGDYINPRLIVMKYYLDKSDPENFTKNYSIHSYPTLLIFDADGVELNRKMGGGANDDIFLKKLEKVLDPESMFPARDKKLVANPEYAIEYARYLLLECMMGEPAVKVIDNLFANNGFKPEYFDDKALELYTKMTSFTDSRILTIFLENEKEIKAAMGAKRLDEFMRSRGMGIIMNEFLKQTFDKQKLKFIADFVNSKKSLKTFFSEFFADNLDVILGDDVPQKIKVINKALVKSPSESRHRITSCALLTMDEEAQNKYSSLLAEMYAIALKNETDAGNRRFFELRKVKFEKLSND